MQGAIRLSDFNGSSNILANDPKAKTLDCDSNLWARVNATDADVIYNLRNTNDQARDEFLANSQLIKPRNEYGNLDISAAREKLEAASKISADIESGYWPEKESELALYVLRCNIAKNEFLLANHRVNRADVPNPIDKARHMTLNETLYGSPDVNVFWSLLQRDMKEALDKNPKAADGRPYRELLELLSPIQPSDGQGFTPSEGLVGQFSRMVIEFFGSMLDYIPSNKNRFTPYEACQIANEILANELRQPRDGWHAVVDSNRTSASANRELKLVSFPGKRNKGDYSRAELRAILVHEIGVHVLRSLPYDSFRIDAFSSGLPEYISFEEGVARACEIAVNGEYKPSGIRHYISIGLASLLGMTFREVFEIQRRLESLKPDGNIGLAFDSVQRAFRGTGKLPNNKDLAYYNGSAIAWRFIEEHIGDPLLFDHLFLSGKTDASNPIHTRFVYEARTGGI